MTGHLVKAAGVAPMMSLGTLLLAAGFGILHAGTSFAHFACGQTLIGLGWNFAFVAATAGLQRQTRPAERLHVQAANDISVFGLSGTGSLLSALALDRLGWRGMQNVGFVTAAIVLATIAMSERLEHLGRTKPPAAAPAGAEQPGPKGEVTLSKV